MRQQLPEREGRGDSVLVGGVDGGSGAGEFPQPLAAGAAGSHGFAGSGEDERRRDRGLAGADARIQATHNRKDEAMEKKDFYSVKEVAKIFNVSTKTVLSSIKKGKIQASKFGNNNSHWRIPASEILPKE